MEPSSPDFDNQKIISAHYDQGSMKHEQKYFPEKLLKYFDLKRFWSEKNISRKTEKIFSAHSDQGSMKQKKVVSRKYFKNLDLEIFGPSHSRYVPPVSRALAS